MHFQGSQLQSTASEYKHYNFSLRSSSISMELSSMSEKIGDFFMATGEEQLVSFIAKAREEGGTDEQIARSLYSVGWRKERVDAAFMNANEARTGAFAPAEGERHAPGEEKQAPEEEKEPAQQGRVRLSTPLGGSRLQSTSPAQLELRSTGRESAQHFPEGSPPNMQPQQPSMQPAPSRITPPSRPQQPPMVQPEQQPQEQPIYPQEE